MGLYVQIYHKLVSGAQTNSLGCGGSGAHYIGRYSERHYRHAQDSLSILTSQENQGLHFIFSRGAIQDEPTKCIQLYKIQGTR